MKSSKDNLEKLFEGFDNLEIEPDEGLWDKVAARLNEKKRPRRIWLWLILLMTAGGGMVGYRLYEDSRQSASGSRQSTVVSRQESASGNEEAGGSRQEAGGSRQELESGNEEAAGSRQEPGARSQEAGGSNQLLVINARAALNAGRESANSVQNSVIRKIPVILGQPWAALQINADITEVNLLNNTLLPQQPQCLTTIPDTIKFKQDKTFWLELSAGPLWLRNKYSGDYVASLLNRTSSRGNGVNLNLALRYKFNNYFSINSGIDYMQLEQQSARYARHYEGTVMAIDQERNIMSFQRYSIKEEYYRQQYHMLRFHAGLDYTVRIMRRFAARANAGLYYTYVPLASFNSEFDPAKPAAFGDRTAIQKNVTGYRLGLGIEYKHGEMLAFHVIPSFSSDLNPVIRHSLFRQRMAFTDVMVGVSYRIQ